MAGKIFAVACVGLAVFCLTSFAAPQKGTAADGRQVYLKDDGTWRYITQDDIAAEKAAKEDSIAKAAAATAAEVRAKEAEKTRAAAEASNEPRVVAKKRLADEPERTALVDVIKSDRSFDVRKARWGMTRDEVKKSEELQLLTDAKDRLEYKFVLLGIKSRIVYRFVDARLSGAEYLIEQDDVNPSRFYDDFQNLKEHLRRLYGTPVSDDKDWKNDIYKGDEKNWGFAISLGFLACHTEWQNASTKITLNQTGGNHLIKTNIEYGARKEEK